MKNKKKIKMSISTNILKIEKNKTEIKIYTFVIFNKSKDNDKQQKNYAVRKNMVEIFSQFT